MKYLVVGSITYLMCMIKCDICIDIGIKKKHKKTNV